VSLSHCPAWDKAARYEQFSAPFGLGHINQVCVRTICRHLLTNLPSERFCCLPIQLLTFPGLGQRRYHMQPFSAGCLAKGYEAQFAKTFAHFMRGSHYFSEVDVWRRIEVKH
jgi:hypothetical protein